MSPFIRNKDIVYIKNKPWYRIGDVVLLTNSHNQLLLHRIVRTTRAGVITRGDALPLKDDGVSSYSSIIGKVERVAEEGLNFHLHFPFSFIIAQGIFQKIHSRHFFCRKAGKCLAHLLG